MKYIIYLHSKYLKKILFLSIFIIFTSQTIAQNINLENLPNCSGNDCVINNDVNNDIDVTKNHTNIVNNATIGTGKDALEIKSSVTIDTLTNNGVINGYIGLSDSTSIIKTLNNYGSINGIVKISGGNSQINKLNNYGSIYLYNQQSSNNKYVTFKNESGGSTIITIGNYHIHLNQDSATFNTFSGYSNYTKDTSHLVIDSNDASNNNGIIKITKDSKFILSVGSNFNLNTDYSLDKLITDENGNKFNLKYKDNQVLVSNLFQHLTTQSPTFYLERNGNYFKIGIDTQSSIGNTIYKSNIQAMNSLSNHINVFSTSSMANGYTLALNDSKEAIYLAKDFREYDRFYYKNDENKTMLARAGVRGGSRAQSSKRQAYDFFFAPFVSHTILTKSNGFGLSGLSYGFVSGISFKIGSMNTLGIHTGFSYGEISGSKDTATTTINTMNAAFGLHYKLDLAYGFYLKAFGDAFYFLNNVSLNQNTQTPSAFGYSGSAYFGKDFDFDDAGNLSIDIGGSYQGIQNNEINFDSEIYKKNIINLIYADLYTNYSKNFDSGFGLNTGIGAKMLFTKPTARIIVGGYNDFEIGADKILGYARLGLNYNINHSVIFNLDYIGSIGDKSINNSGIFNIRVLW